jgi:hypothetical protein
MSPRTSAAALPVSGPHVAAHAGAPGLPYWCLLLFTIVAFVAPQAMFPSLQELSIGRLTAGLAIATYVMHRLAHGRSLSVGAPECRLMVWFVLLAAVSIPFSLWPGGSRDMLTGYLLKSAAVFFLIANLVDTPDRMRTFVGLLLACGAIIASEAVSEYLGLGDLTLTSRIRGYESGLTANANDLAMTLNLIIGLAAGLYRATRNQAGRLVLLAAIGLCAAGVVVSFSRAGLLGLVTIGVIYHARLFRDRAWVAAGSLAALLLAASVLLPTGYLDRLQSAFDSSVEAVGYGSVTATARLELLKQGLISALKRPLGAGLGMDILALREDGMGTWTATHNAYLQIALELGVPGLLIFLALIRETLVGLLRALRETRAISGATASDGLGSGILMSLVALLVQFAFAPVPYHLYLYYVLGLSVAFQAMVRPAVAAAGRGAR